MGVAVDEEDDEDILGEGVNGDEGGDGVGAHELKMIAKKNREKFAIKKSYSIEVRYVIFFSSASYVPLDCFTREIVTMTFPRKSRNFFNCVT